MKIYPETEIAARQSVSGNGTELFKVMTVFKQGCVIASVLLSAAISAIPILLVSTCFSESELLPELTGN